MREGPLKYKFSKSECAIPAKATAVDEPPKITFNRLYHSNDFGNPSAGEKLFCNLRTPRMSVPFSQQPTAAGKNTAGTYSVSAKAPAANDCTRHSKLCNLWVTSVFF